MTTDQGTAAISADVAMTVAVLAAVTLRNLGRGADAQAESALARESGQNHNVERAGGSRRRGVGRKWS